MKILDDYTLSFKYLGHDPSAAIFKNGQLIFAVEEERFSRNKHALNEFPIQSIKACLSFCNIQMHNIKEILIPWVPKLCFQNEVNHFLQKPSFNSLLTLGHEFKVYYEFEKLVETILKSSFNGRIPPIHLIEHHYCHALSAFYPSGFENAIILTIDGRGEYDSTVIFKGDTTGIKRIYTFKFPNSLGFFYAIITKFLGFRVFNGEGKVMALAPYGEPNYKIETKLRKIAKFGKSYDVTWLTSQGISKGVKKIEKLFGQPSRPSFDITKEFTDFEKSLAYTAQKLLEETVIELVKYYSNILRIRNICLAGGVALNCKMNKKIMDLSSIDQLFIQPVANDAGLVIGAGFHNNIKIQKRMTNVYLGPEYKKHEIKDMLIDNKIQFEVPCDKYKTVAKLLSEGKLVGWFQGRMEMGPRALGNRSILADPRLIKLKDDVNKYVKHRENWRPFAPSILEEKMGIYIKRPEFSPFMIKTFDTTKRARMEIPAVLHPIDYTTRPHSVTQLDNPDFYRLICEFEKITGIPVLLNTSFNDHGEPIVNSPKEALKDFYSTGLDVLVIGDLLIRKNGVKK